MDSFCDVSEDICCFSWDQQFESFCMSRWWGHDSLSNRDNRVQKERQIYFEFLTVVASSVKLMLDRACSH